MKKAFLKQFILNLLGPIITLFITSKILSQTNPAVFLHCQSTGCFSSTDPFPAVTGYIANINNVVIPRIMVGAEASIGLQ